MGCKLWHSLLYHFFIQIVAVIISYGVFVIIIWRCFINNKAINWFLWFFVRAGKNINDCLYFKIFELNPFSMMRPIKLHWKQAVSSPQRRRTKPELCRSGCKTHAPVTYLNPDGTEAESDRLAAAAAASQLHCKVQQQLGRSIVYWREYWLVLPGCTRYGCVSVPRLVWRRVCVFFVSLQTLWCGTGWNCVVCCFFVLFPRSSFSMLLTDNEPTRWREREAPASSSPFRDVCSKGIGFIRFSDMTILKEVVRCGDFEPAAGE